MKKLLLSAMIAMSVFPAMADLEGDGYYRVENAITKRFAYLLDDKGWVDYRTTSADVGAIELYLDIAKACSDPATVFYINHITSSSSKYEHDIAGQGTNLHSFFNLYMKILAGKKIDGQQAYYASGTISGVAKYLGDIRSNANAEKGLTSVESSGDRRLWYILPISADSPDNYFGVAPTLTCDGKYFNPMYAGFPYDGYSEGLKFYTVTKINQTPDNPAVAIKEVTGVIPSGTPVIIECSNPLPTGNRLDLDPTGTPADVKDNMLKGVYFNNDDEIHKNRVAYDRKTMRILTVKNGKLVFDVADIDYLPRNQAYLQLSNAEQYNVDCYDILTEEEFDDRYNAVDFITVSSIVDVYSVDGHLVRSGILKEEVPSLGKGIYILRSGEVSEKLIVP